MKKLLIIFFLLIGMNFIRKNCFVYGQTDSLQREQLANLGLYPFPNSKDLNNLLLKDDLIKAQPLLIDDINQDFSNIKDLQWLESIAQQNKVILFGEHHYYKYVTHLRNRILFALNTYDFYPVIIKEDAYSLTGYINYYLNIEDEDIAEKYFKEVINEMILIQEDYYLFQHIKRWNKFNPEKKITVVYSDIEHEFIRTIRDVIIPYFNKMNVNLSVDLDNFGRFDLEVLIPILEQEFVKAKEINLIGDYPFLTPEYIFNVIENLKSTIKAMNYEFMYYRHKAIIRNITDPSFLGNYFKNGKVMIYGGSWHTPTHLKYPDDGNFLSQGSYLTYDFEPTKGKTYSITVQALARSIGNMLNVKPDPNFYGGNYRKRVSTLQKAFDKGLIKQDSYVLEWKVNSLDSLLIKKSIQMNSQVLMLESIDWENIINIIKSKNSEQYVDITSPWSGYGFYKKYDLHICIPQSPITEARIKSYMR